LCLEGREFWSGKGRERKEREGEGRKGGREVSDRSGKGWDRSPSYRCHRCGSILGPGAAGAPLFKICPSAPAAAP